MESILRVESFERMSRLFQNVSNALEHMPSKSGPEARPRFSSFQKADAYQRTNGG